MSKKDMVTQTVYQIPPPEKRQEILATNRLKRKRPISEKEFYFTVSQILPVHRTRMVGVMGYLTMLASGDFGKLTVDQKKLIIELLKTLQKQIREINELLALEKLRKATNKKA
jgi:hypothetical protein